MGVRIVAVSRADPPSLLSGKALSEQLFYRLSTAHLSVPPLRERRGDP